MGLDVVADLLACPVCDRPLEPAGPTFHCADGHAFDVARHGQLNLLNRSAPRHADTAEMVAARDRFLGAGHYRPVVAAATEAARTVVGVSPAVLEVGSGTGYYLAGLVDALGGRGLALDVSAYAARRAARSSPRVGAVVADAWRRLPVRDGVLDLVLCVFAPRNAAEFVRVLRPGGAVVVVTPQPGHLAELRQPLGLLDVDPAKDERLAATFADRLVEVSRGELTYAVTARTPDVVDLVAMGPNAFHTDLTAVRAAVDALPHPVAFTVAVTLTTWRPATP